MTFTAYLQPSEYAAYGIPAATAAQVNAATRLIETYLGRPEGLLWSPDGNAMPAFMTNMVPTQSFTGSALTAGTGVTLTVPSALFGYQDVGDVAIIDRATPNLTEACVVTAASGNTLTLANVQFAHPAPTVEFGLTILDEVSTRVRLSRSPVVNILSGFGRHGYGREMRQIGAGLDEYESLLVTNYGQAGVSGWGQLDTTTWDINGATGAVRMPRYGHENTRIRYVAGWSQANLPGTVKQATANVVNALGDDRNGGDIRLLKSGDATQEWFGSGVMDTDTRSLLQPYKPVRI